MKRSAIWRLTRTAFLAASLTAVLLRGVPVGAVDSVAVWPVSGAIAAEFDPPDPDWLPGHRGLDLVAAPGAEVRSPRDGVLAYAAMVAGVPVVVVSHGIARATYQPVETRLPVGAPIAAGDRIGVVVGEGGHCSGSCLHWGLRIADRYADPRLLLGRVQVVLMPDSS